MPVEQQVSNLPVKISALDFFLRNAIDGLNAAFRRSKRSTIRSTPGPTRI